MLRSEVYSRVISSLLLVAFCAATICFQNTNLKNYYSVKAQQESSIDQSFNSQLGLLEEENQTNSNKTLEEEDDEFKLDSIFLASQHCEQLALQFLILQESLFSDQNSEVVSPPPQC